MMETNQQQRLGLRDNTMTPHSGLHILFIVGLLCLAGGIFLHLVGIATSQWSATEGTPTLYYGLWDTCVGEVCSEYSEEFKTSSLNVCQVFAVLGVVMAGLTLILSLVFCLMIKLRKAPKKVVPLIAMILAALALVFIVICVVTWAAGMPMRNQVRHRYSFALSIVGGILIATGGVLVFLGSEIGAPDGEDVSYKGCCCLRWVKRCLCSDVTCWLTCRCLSEVKC